MGTSGVSRNDGEPFLLHLSRLSQPLFWIAQSCILFLLAKSAISYAAPREVRGTKNYWSWCNTANSMFHSVVSGVWSVYCFGALPAFSRDLIFSSEIAAHRLVAFSIGYFVYDLADILRNTTLRKSWDIIAHHIVVITCFGLAVITHRYTGYAVCALLVEINSVFLHWRKLLRLAGGDRSSRLWQLVSWTNLATFVVCRIGAFGFMSYWQVSNWHRLPTFVAWTGATGMVLIIMMNSVLFWRLLRSDVLRQQKKQI